MNQNRPLIHKSPPVGQEISCVMHGVNEIFLNKNLSLKKIIQNLLIEQKFNVLSVSSHDFTPQGFTLLFLLSESHLAVHTYPEYNSIYLSLYSCRGESDSLPVFKKLVEILHPKKFLYNQDHKVPVEKN